MMMSVSAGTACTYNRGRACTFFSIAIAVAIAIAIAIASADAHAQEIQITGPLSARTCSPENDDECQVRIFPERSARGTAGPRSASDWFVEGGERDRPNGLPLRRDIDSPSPGVIVAERGAYLRAPRLSLRGFEATNGQDAEILYGNIPMNQASNMRAPGYADLRLVMPEAIRSVRVSSGPYDPHQGDFALGGSVQLEPGLQRSGITAKGTYGSFGTRRLLLSFAPADLDWSESFGALEVYGTDGPGSAGRGADRTSFVGQVAWGHSDSLSFKGTVAIGTARAEFPGYLDQRSVEGGLVDRYASRDPLGWDRTSQAHLGTDCTWRVGEGRLKIGAWASKTKMAFRQNLTGFLVDRRATSAGLSAIDPDDSEQVNEANTLGLTTAFLREVAFISDDSRIELGTSARIDSIEQTDTRLREDGTRISRPIDATIDATNLAAFIDAYLHPIRRLAIRGGPRLDSLSYVVHDRASPLGVQRTSQGFHLGNKATLEVSLADWGDRDRDRNRNRFRESSPTSLMAIASYGEGFRSPQARTLREGDRVPFATIRSVETGLRFQRDHRFRASLASFASWLSQERVFDADARENGPAPSSSRLGLAGAVGSRWTVQRSTFLSGLSATYARSTFTGSDARFRSGDPVPYIPRLVVRADTAVTAKLTTISDDEMWGKIGVGAEGAAASSLPSIASSPSSSSSSALASAKNVFFVDARASIEWREVEVGVTGTNLLGLRSYDSQYVYASSFDRSPQGSIAPAQPRSNILVATPTMVLVTLDLHYPKRKKEEEMPRAW